MPFKSAASFEVKFLQVLNEKGEVDSKLEPRISGERLKQFYEWMVLARVFDEKAIALQRQGRIGTYASVRGQEACQVGSACLLNDLDWVFPAFRENAALIVRKTPLKNLLLYWGGDERGSVPPLGVRNFPVAIPVSSQIPHAVGAAWACRLRNEKNVSLVYFGDGATSRGDFHEALNFAGVFKIPVIFLCQNNQYAISVPRSRQSAAQTLAQKAVAYGIEGIQVDGNDLLAVYVSVQEALERARAGKGPTLIECFTYRLGDHTTSDDAKRYRTESEVEEWKKKDPLARFELYLASKKLFSKEYQSEVLERAQALVDQAVQEYESVPLPAVSDLFNYVAAQLDANVSMQKARYLEGVGAQDVVPVTPVVAPLVKGPANQSSKPGKKRVSLEGSSKADEVPDF
ncbi:MAG: pyruvate dehydrogenase (acetyl-transferring) E1 component subunit alpha [Candidatus Diapherotrites archaeon]|nr:pyruvate dehydrogenase (acetyl-transferring) E1 component subunit alpha [Candidatus Diapherotrites archaeon]